MFSLIGFSRDLIRNVGERDIMGSAAELAFRFLFALFPFFIFLAALSGFVARWLNINDPAHRLVTQLGDVLPADAAAVVERNLEGVFESNSAGLLSFGAIVALWAASSGTKTVLKEIDRAYHASGERPFLRKQVLGFTLTLLGGVAFLVATVVLIVGQVVGHEIASAIGFGDAGATLVTLARIPVVLVILVVTITFIYRVAPNAPVTVRQVLPGAVLFVVLWLLATLGFAIYVANFGAYEATYGALGSVIVLMTWLYLSALMLLLGAEVNAVLYDREQRSDTEGDGEPGEDAAGAAEPSRPSGLRRLLYRS